MDARPAWGFQVLDHEANGSWTWAVDRADMMEIMEFLSEMEKRTWAEIRRDMTGGHRRRGEKHKFIPLADLC